MSEVKEAPKPKTANGQGQTTEISRSTAPATPVAPQGSPFAFMRRFTEEMDHLFEDFGFGSGCAARRSDPGPRTGQA